MMAEQKQVIPEGYKQAETGIIPKDWVVAHIRDICEVYGRIGFRGYTKADIVSQEQGVLSISPSNILDGVVTFNNGTYITTQKYEESPEIKIFNNDILLVKTGSTFGKTAIVKNLLEKATLNPQVVVLKNLKCESFFLSCMMQFSIIQDQIKNTIVGGAIPTLSQKEVLAYKIPLPPKQEQTSIANALSDVDALISKLEKLIAKKQAIKTATMQQLLTGKTRLPQFSLREDGTPKGYKASELGEIPEDWEVKILSTFSDFITKGSTPTTYGFGWEKEGVLFLRSECVSDDGLDLSQSMFISEKANRVLSRSEVASGDILMTITGNVGRVIFLSNEFQTANINQHIARVRVSTKEVNSSYVYHYLSQSIIRCDLNKITTGQAYPQLSLEQVRCISILLPLISEQIAISSILSDMDEEIKTLQQRLTKTRKIKQGMMQELLTGRVRLLKGEYA